MFTGNIIMGFIFYRLFVCNNVNDFNERKLCITENLLKLGYRYHKLRKTFFNVSQLVFYGDLIGKINKIKGAYLVVNPLSIDRFASLFVCMTLGGV
jgi:hypothetical protein